MRARQTAGACILLAIAAVAAAAFGFYGMRDAQKTRTIAEAARGESERLIVYLLDDFYRELEPVGRLEIVGELAKRALAYYDGLPAELRGSETLRNQALAQGRYGAVLRNQGRNEEAAKMLDASVATLAAMRTRGDRSEPTTIGLAMALSAQARLSAAQPSESLVPARRAVEVIKEAAAAPDASPAVRRARAAVLTGLGFTQQRSGRNEEALVALRAALDADRSIDGLKSDNDAAANFALTSAWLMDALQALGRTDESLQVGEEGRKVATAVLDRQPTHMLATACAGCGRVEQRERLRRAIAAGTALRVRRCLGSRLADARAHRSEQRDHDRQPRNCPHQRRWRALGSRSAARGCREVLQNAETEANVVAKAPIAQSNLAYQHFLAATANAERGEVATADRQWAEAGRIYAAWVLTFPPKSYGRRYRANAFPDPRVEYAVARGDTRMRARPSGERARRSGSSIRVTFRADARRGRRCCVDCTPACCASSLKETISPRPKSKCDGSRRQGAISTR